MRHANVSVPGVTAFLLMAALLLLPSHVHADHEFTELREKWRDWLVGAEGLSLAYYNDPDIFAARLNLAEQLNDPNTGVWATMNKDSKRTYLYADAADNTNPAHMTLSYRRLKIMATAVSTWNSPVYLHYAATQDLISALDWMYENRYNEHKRQQGNWWHWEIGTPQLLNDITVLVYDQLTESQRTKYMNAVRHFVPDPTVRQSGGVKETGLYRAQKALICVIAGIIDKNSDTIALGQEAVSSEVFEYVRTGNGFFEDGSYVNTYSSSTGAHGHLQFAAVTDLLSVLGDSRWRITDPNQQNVYRWAKESIIPFIYRGAMMDNVRGRSISRSGSQDHAVGREVVTAVARLSMIAESHEAEYLQHVVKQWVTEDTTFANYYAGLDIADAIRLKEIMRNPSIAIEDELHMSKVYGSMARAVHRQPGYGFAVSMFSPRIIAFDYNNDENRKGWYTGMGMTTLYDSDVNQFSEDYWATVDMYRLPGTTTDGALSDAQRLFNTKTWVGGASLDDKFSAVGMDFSLDKSTGSSLQGKKSWFMFPDAIYCMGTGIRGTGGRNVETIVENRRLRGGGAERVLSVNGEQVTSPSMGRSESQWAWSAHISGVDGAAGTGYYFPQGANIETMRDVRTGSWSDVNQGGSTAALTNTFLSVSIPHGSNPADERYHYIVLPGKTAAETEDYVPNPVQIQVVSDSETIHAVSQMKADEYIISAANFWSADSVYYFEAESPLSVFMREDLLSRKLHVAISDPTQAQNSVVLGLLMKGYVLDSKDEEVTVSMTESKINIQVRTAGAQGATFHAVFRKA